MFRSAEERKAFNKFLKSESSVVALILLQTIFDIITFRFCLCSYSISSSSSLIVTCLLYSPNLIGWCLVYLKLCLNRQKYSRIESRLENCYVIACSVVGGLHVFIRTLQGSNADKINHSLISSLKVSNMGTSSFTSLENDAFVLMLSSTIFSIVVKGACFEVIFSSWIISVLFVFASIMSTNSVSSIGFVCLAVPLTALVLFELQRQMKSIFDLTERMQYLIKENAKMSSEMHANEMRHMIGNVAHDLKTPLTAFVTALEYVQSVSSEIQTKVVERTLTTEFVGGAIEGIGSTLKNAENLTSFMTMSINRCIDYTKATNGLKLTARFETVYLKESIELPINCMKDLQAANNINIDFDDNNLSTVCSHIITDKQWLQENLLCLLSNAVKYSKKGAGDIKISIQLTRRKIIAPSYPELFDASLAEELSLKIEENKNKSEEDLFGHFLLFEITDCGIGLTEEAMQTLFKPFSQAQRQAGGAGLGLFSLARRLEALHGFYGVKKRIDNIQGSIFWFEIPYRPDHIHAEMKLTENLMFVETNINGFNDNNVLLETSNGVAIDLDDKAYSSSKIIAPKPPPLCLIQSNLKIGSQKLSITMNETPRLTPLSLNVLVVDDSLPILKMTSLLLRRNTHVVTTAENGAEAVVLVTSSGMTSMHHENKSHLKNGPPFDVVLMDLQMPVMDGLEAIRRIRLFENEIENSQKKCKQKNMKCFNFAHTEQQKRTLYIKQKKTDIEHKQNENTQDEIENKQNKKKRLLIISLSANSDYMTCKEALLAGADEFLPKPFSLQSFYLLLKKYDIQ